MPKENDSGWCMHPAGTCIFGSCKCKAFVEPETAKREVSRKLVASIQDITPETWKKVGSWLASHVHDVEIDSDQIDEEQGRDLMPALRGIVEWALSGGPKKGET